MTEKNKNRAIGRQVRKMIAAAMAAMLVVTSANVADVNAEETVLAVSENTTVDETTVVEAEKDTESNTGEPEVENSEAENTDLDAETAEAHTYENGFCTDSGCDAYQPAVLTTDKYDVDGDGKMDEAYEIGNAGQLYWFAGLVNGTLTDGTAQNLKANAVLTADITVNEKLLENIDTDKDGNVTNGNSFRAWRPMGSKWNVCAGIFDGDKHSICGLYANPYDTSISAAYAGKDYIGLFGVQSGSGVIRNVGIRDSYIRGSYYIGSICGFNNGGTIQNCDSTAAVYGQSYLGGICGRSYIGSKIENCHNAGNIHGNNLYIGGICGQNYFTIENCYNSGNVEGKEQVGGIVGSNKKINGNWKMADCYNRGNVSGESYIGGICGDNDSGLIENCYSQATASGTIDVGGICGYSVNGTFEKLYYDADLYTGGALGYGRNMTIKETEGKSSQTFVSGEIAYLLQAGRGEAIWGQTLSGENPQSYPVLGGAMVYRNSTYLDCTKDDEAYIVYTYENEQKTIIHHTMQEEIKAKEPTCTEAGNIAHYACSACGKLYTDQEGTKEVSAEAVVLPAKGHSFTWIIDKEATEQAEGSRHEECSICHEKKAAVAIPKLPSNTKPGEQPSQTPGEQPGQDTKVPAKGTKLTAKDGARYQVTSAAGKNPTVAYTGSKKQKATVTIPATVKINNVTYKVTSIAANAFKNNKKLKKVVIGKNITRIGKKAFYGCSKLKSVTVKTTKLTKKNVGSQAFKGIHKKAAFKVPKKKISSYRKAFKARGAAKTIKVTK